MSLILAIPIKEGQSTHFSVNKKRYSLNCYSLPGGDLKMVSIQKERKNFFKSKTLASFARPENLGMTLYHDPNDVHEEAPKILVTEGKDSKALAFVYLEG